MEIGLLSLSNKCWYVSGHNEENSRMTSPELSWGRLVANIDAVNTAEQVVLKECDNIYAYWNYCAMCNTGVGTQGDNWWMEYINSDMPGT